MAQNQSTDLSEMLVSMSRVSKTVKGGKRYSFSVLVIVGDKNGKVGFGLGKAKGVVEARAKAVHDAKKALVRVPLKESRTLHYSVTGKFGAGLVVLRTAPPGTGIIAGSAMRPIFELLGIHDVVAKSVGSSNPHNMVKATFSAFKKLYSPRATAERRGIKVGDLLKTKLKNEIA